MKYLKYVAIVALLAILAGAIYWNFFYENVEFGSPATKVSTSDEDYTPSPMIITDDMRLKMEEEERLQQAIDEFDEDIEPYLLNEMWQDPDKAKENLAEALLYAKDELTDWAFLIHYAVPNPSNEEDFNYDKPFDILWKYLRDNRKKIDLHEIFRQYAPTLRRIIPREVVREHNLHKLLNYLNASYTHLYHREQMEDDMEAIYAIMTKDRDSKDYEAQCEEIVKLLGGKDTFDSCFSDDDEGEYFLDRAVVWSYSFWARRHQDGLVDTAIDIMGGVERIYELHIEDYDRDYNEDYDDNQHSEEH